MNTYSDSTEFRSDVICLSREWLALAMFELQVIETAVNDGLESPAEHGTRAALIALNYLRRANGFVVQGQEGGL